MSNRELAHDLKVDERTVRAWTKGREGYATPPIGVTEELTAALDAGADIRDIMASMGVSTMDMVHYYDRAHASIRRNTSHRVANYIEK